MLLAGSSPAFSTNEGVEEGIEFLLLLSCCVLGNSNDCGGVRNFAAVVDPIDPHLPKFWVWRLSTEIQAADLPIFQQVLCIPLESIVSHFQDICAMGILQGLGRVLFHHEDRSSAGVNLEDALEDRINKDISVSLCHPGGDSLGSSFEGGNWVQLSHSFVFLQMAQKNLKNPNIG